MLRVADEVCNESCRMVLTVHDSIILEVREDLIRDTIPKVEHLMTDWPDFKVKLAVDTHEWGKKE
jgi:DNA polymerase I-like protein with 3'-5' exonuclease and polymerase domains